MLVPYSIRMTFDPSALFTCEVVLRGGVPIDAHFPSLLSNLHCGREGSDMVLSLEALPELTEENESCLYLRP